MNTQPRFSVLMPVYNRERYLRQAIDSVLSQTFTDFELLAIDDGSTDASLEILRAYGSRITVLEQRNQGAEVARNAAAAVARGEYLAFLDSDDFLLPHALDTYDRIIRQFDSPPVLLGSEIYHRDGDILPEPELASGPIEVLKFRDYLSRTRTMWLTSPCSKLVFRKSVFDEVGGHRHSTPQTWHDDDLHILLKTGTHGPCLVVRRPHTCVYRIHGENSIKNVTAIAEGMIRLAQDERRGEYPGGWRRRIDRYAVIGGRSATWAFRYCWRGGQRALAIRLLARTAPMVCAAAWRKLMRNFHQAADTIVLADPTLSSRA